MSSQPEAKPPVWPQLRNDLAVAFNDYDLEGKPQWLIHDSGRNKFFLIGWLEYEIYERWQLGNIEAIIESINNETTLHAEKEDIENFLGFLKRNYLLRLSSYEIKKQAGEQQLFKNDSMVHWLISNYLFFRIPLVHPDNFLSKTLVVADIVFSRTMAYVMSVLGLIALYQLSNRWEQFVHTFASIFTLQGLFFSMIAFLISKLCHELGHAYRTKQYGVSVPAAGVAFLVFWPVLYTDTTLSWSLDSGKRMRIALAGIWVETYITIIAALIWCNTDNQTLQTLCYITITVNWLASLLVNVSPFMRFDGYYVLADYLKMPNLQHRAFALTRWQIRKILFGWNDPPPEKFTTRMHWFLIGYSLFTWIYRLILYIGIAILVYHFFAKIVGIILFLIELHYFIFAPFVTEFQTWYAMKERFTFNINTKITIAVTSLLMLLFFTPFSQTYKLPATLRFAHEFLVAPESGILAVPLPAVHSQIKANQTIAVIRSAQLTQAIRETKLEYNKTMGQLRSAGIDKQILGQKNIFISDLKRLQAEYQKLLKLQKRLNLQVPFDGVLIEKAMDVFPGSYVMKGQWLGDVIEPNQVMIEAFVPQIDVNAIKINTSGYFYAYNYSVPAVPVKVVLVELINAKQLECNYSAELKQFKGQDTIIETPCYNASDLGGEIPTNLNEEGGYEPTASFYRVLLKTDEKFTSNYVERGNVFLKSKPQSYAFRLFYKVKSVLIEELGF